MYAVENEGNRKLRTCRYTYRVISSGVYVAYFYGMFSFSDSNFSLWRVMLKNL